jgi:hypothetical protein
MFNLRPFFTFYGGKWRAYKKYPKPKYGTIIEPFAGSAGYSVRYCDYNVILNDIDPKIYGTWDFLIKSSYSDIMTLPIDVGNVDDLKVCQEAKWLIGWWLNQGAASPRKTMSQWGRSRPGYFWGVNKQKKIAESVGRIKHWKVYNCNYDAIPLPHKGNYNWFIDPPYNNPSGKLYRYKFHDYENLAIWCKQRHGLTIVCEQEGADWLPFSPIGAIQTNASKKGKGISKEAAWIQDNYVLPPYTPV